MTVRGLVLAGYGLNCEVETAHALRLAGAEAEVVHISDLAAGKVGLASFGIMVFDGGFAWGDDHGAGVLLATHLKRHLGAQLEEFLARGGLVMGICNGFQALVNLGLLPDLAGSWQREAALAANDCGNFQDRWIEVIAQNESPCLFTKGVDRVDLPIRHGEGKFVAEAETLAAMEAQGLAALRYGDGAGAPAGGSFPQNPNGSVNDIAGICNPSGRVFGLMPHPEGFYRQSQHPDWTLWRERARRKGRELDPQADGGGLVFFVNAVAAAREAA